MSKTEKSSAAAGASSADERVGFDKKIDNVEERIFRLEMDRRTTKLVALTMLATTLEDVKSMFAPDDEGRVKYAIAKKAMAKVDREDVVARLEAIVALTGTPVSPELAAHALLGPSVKEMQRPTRDAANSSAWLASELGAMRETLAGLGSVLQTAQAAAASPPPKPTFSGPEPKTEPTNGKAAEA